MNQTALEVIDTTCTKREMDELNRIEVEFRIPSIDLGKFRAKQIIKEPNKRKTQGIYMN